MNSTYRWQPPGSGTDSYATANSLNQYPQFTPAGLSPHPLTYDGKGNLATGNINGDAVWKFAYDPENRLTTACKPNPCTSPTVSAIYAYDPLGRRIKKSGTGVTTAYYLSDGTDEVAEYDSTKTVTVRYIPGPAIDQPIAMLTVSSGAKEYFHTNHQGSVIAMSDGSGARVEGPYTYDPYGNCFSGGSPCSSTGVPYRFTGRRLDPETGLYYYRARYYTSVLGRFLQTDAIGYTADLNFYTYVGNDPLSRTDPTGMYGMDDPSWNQLAQSQMQFGQQHPSAALAIGIGGVAVMAAPAVVAACAGGGCEAGAGALAARMGTSALVGAPVSAGISAAKGNPPAQVLQAAANGALISAASAACGPGCAGAASVALDIASGKSPDEIAVDAIASMAGSATGRLTSKVGAAPSLSGAAQAIVTKPVSSATSEGIKAVPGFSHRGDKASDPHLCTGSRIPTGGAGGSGSSATSGCH